MAKNKLIENEPSKEFNAIFRTLIGRHSGYTVWQDFVTSFACLISMSVTPEHFKVRKERYEKIRKKYTEKEREAFDELYRTTIAIIGKNPDQDFLGETYMSLEFGNRNCGQFFTPYYISKMMAKMNGVCDEEIMEKGYVLVGDPCCGSGGLLIAFANELKLKYDDISSVAFFVAQDIDHTVSMMCFIQLSLIGCAGYVAVGNSLTNPVPDLTSETTWVTPMCYSKVWLDRFNKKYEEIVRKNEGAA